MPKFSMKITDGCMVLINYLAVQAIMVIKIRESVVMRYLKHAIADMYRNNLTEILCLCRRCKLGKWLDPFSGKL